MLLSGAQSIVAGICKENHHATSKQPKHNIHFYTYRIELELLHSLKYTYNKCVLAFSLFTLTYIDHKMHRTIKLIINNIKYNIICTPIMFMIGICFTKFLCYTRYVYVHTSTYGDINLIVFFLLPTQYSKQMFLKKTINIFFGNTWP